MTDWITDRVPTEADADFEDQVHVPGNFTLDQQSVFAPYTSIQLGQPWMHSDQVVPAAKRKGAKVADKPTLKVGQLWRDGQGNEVRIVVKDSFGFKGKYRGYFYDQNGRWIRKNMSTPSVLDLVELIEDAPAPAPATHRKPRRIVNLQVYTCSDRPVYVAEDDDGCYWAMTVNPNLRMFGSWFPVPSLPGRDEGSADA